MVRTLLMGCVLGGLVLGCSGGQKEQPRYNLKPPPIEAPPETRGPALSVEEIEEIEQTIRVGQDAVIKCYTAELERRGNKDLQGQVMVKIQIGTAGKATSVEIGLSTLKVEQVHQCIKATVMTWEFPTLKSPAPYSRTFDLSPAY